MSTIQELIDSGECVLGETKIALRGTKNYRIPYWKHGHHWVCRYSNNVPSSVDQHEGPFVIYKEPVEMEDRWLWANEFSRVGDGMSPTPWCGYTIKLEGTKTQFPKEKK